MHDTYVYFCISLPAFACVRAFAYFFNNTSFFLRCQGKDLFNTIKDPLLVSMSFSGHKYPAKLVKPEILMPRLLSCHMGRRNDGVLVCCDSKNDRDCESLHAVFSSFKFLLFDLKTVQWQKVFLIKVDGWIS